MLKTIEYRISIVCENSSKEVAGARALYGTLLTICQNFRHQKHSIEGQVIERKPSKRRPSERKPKSKRSSK